MGLTRDLKFVKREITSKDVALLLQTLWRYAKDIPCTLLMRLSFHYMLLLGAVGGFRPGVLLGIQYRQISLELIRVPDTGEKKLVAMFTLKQNKKQKHAVKQHQMDM